MRTRPTGGYTICPRLLEAALASLYRNEIPTEADLPKKLFAHTPCFRREAGSYRADERGMVRGHQFNKVEMFQYTLPEASDIAFDELVAKAENPGQGAGLPFPDGQAGGGGLLRVHGAHP